MTCYFDESPESMARSLLHDARIEYTEDDYYNLVDEIGMLMGELDDTCDAQGVEPIQDAFGASRVLLRRIGGRGNLRMYLDGLKNSSGTRH